MKKEFVEFLLKRMSSKVDKARILSEDSELVTHIDDLEDYIDTLKDVISAVIEP